MSCVAEYLIERLQETDGLLEVCESESAPAGWRCNWSRKEKQYYYIHEITEEISWSYPEEDIAAVRKLASQQRGKSKKKANASAGTLSQLNDAIEARTVDTELKALFLQKIVDKCTETEKDSESVNESTTSNGTAGRDVARDTKTKSDSKTRETESKSNAKTTDTKTKSSAKTSETEAISESKTRDTKTKSDVKSRHKSRSRSQSQSRSSRSAKRKRTVSDSSPVVKHKKSKRKQEKKSKKHSKSKKSKTPSKKSKHKKRRSSSSSSGELPDSPKITKALKEPEYDWEEHDSDLSPLPSVTTPEHLTTSTSERLSAKIFKLDHSNLLSKVLESRNSATNKSDGNIDGTKASTSHSAVDVTPAEQLDLEISSVNVQSQDDSPKLPPSAVTPPTPAATPPDRAISVSPSDLSPVKDISEEEMDISPTPSGVTTPEPPVEKATPPPVSSANAEVVGEKAEKRIETEDDMDSFLESIQRDLLKDKLEPTGITSTAPPPPPPEPEDELPPPKAAETYSKAAAPVFYAAAVDKPVVIAHAPLQYSHPVQPEPAPALPIPAVIERGPSPIRYHDTTAQLPPPPPATAPAVASEASRPLKDKHKAKKSSKKSKKMPAALVQKWQQVQSQITTDIEKEQKLKDELFK